MLINYYSWFSFLNYYYYNKWLYKYTYLFLNSYFSIYLFYMGVILGLLVFFLSFNRFKYTFKFGVYLYLLFIALVYNLVTTNNLFQFFFYYEFLFTPSFLLVYFTAPNRRGVFASLYFFFWTQGGSLFLLIGWLYMYISTGLCLFTEIKFVSQYFSNIELNLIAFLCFLGFGIKIPVWPFYYWLTKTHVEAPTFFSIYLSGFLVKTALYGLYLWYLYFPSIIISYFFIGIVIFGVHDSTIKMWSQTDLKKLVAFGTVQEMNLITLLFLFGGVQSSIIGILFCLTHTILSTLFFFIVDVIYRLYRVRTRSNLVGLSVLNPWLGFYIIISVILYTGLPFTLKFICEFNLFIFLLHHSISQLVFLILTIQIIGNAIWMYQWFGILYGQPHTSLYRTGGLLLTDHLVFIIAFSHLIFGTIISLI